MQSTRNQVERSRCFYGINAFLECPNFDCCFYNVQCSVRTFISDTFTSFLCNTLKYQVPRYLDTMWCVWNGKFHEFLEFFTCCYTKPSDSNGYPNCRMESSSARCHLSHGFGAGTWHMRVIASAQHVGITMDKAERVRHDNIIPHDSHMDTVGETNGYIIIHTLFPSNRSLRYMAHVPFSRSHQVTFSPATYVQKLSWDNSPPLNRHP